MTICPNIEKRIPKIGVDFHYLWGVEMSMCSYCGELMEQGKCHGHLGIDDDEGFTEQHGLGSLIWFNEREKGGNDERS